MITNIRALSLIYKKSEFFQKNIHIDIGKEGLSVINSDIYRGEVFYNFMNDY